MKITGKRSTRLVAGLVGVALLVGLLAPLVGAESDPVTPPRLEGGGPEFAGDPLTVPELPPYAPADLPDLTEEQEQLLGVARRIVEEMGETVRQAVYYAGHENWAQTEVELLDYVSSMVTLERAVDSFLASLDNDQPFPFRFFLRPILEALATQVHDLAAVWAVLPDANRVPVIRAVEAAAQASDHPGFWRALVRLVHSQTPQDPGALRARLEHQLDRARANLAAAKARIDSLEQRIADLEEHISSTSDPDELERLNDLKTLAELDVGVCQAQVARDEFAVEALEDMLAGTN